MRQLRASLALYDMRVAAQLASNGRFLSGAEWHPQFIAGASPVSGSAAPCSALSRVSWTL